MDVNKQVVSEWVAETTPYERVREVIAHTYEPQSVASIAERARVDEAVTAEHLSELVDEGFADEADGQYRRDPKDLLDQQASDIRDTVDRETLVEGIREMEEGEVDETTERNLRAARAALDRYDEE
ncbi:hypothetical protein ACFQE1_02105 [Halobium palmae]|uniref:Transcriptional regulator n=1 Tax=Halobium palmae TaxID=1776492 RepID=A0ABD5RUU9_9EURY